MKLAFAALFILISANVFYGQTIDIPESILSDLNKSYPGWRLSVVDDEIKEFLEKREAGSQPNLISGDFVGNGQKDYTMLIEHKNFEAPDKTFTHVLENLAFLKLGNKYKKFVLDDYQPAASIIYLTLAKKGVKSREFETGKKFKYPNDSISISYFEKAGGTYIYEKGRFRYVIESD